MCLSFFHNSISWIQNKEMTGHLWVYCCSFEWSRLIGRCGGLFIPKCPRSMKWSKIMKNRCILRWKKTAKMKCWILQRLQTDTNFFGWFVGANHCCCVFHFCAVETSTQNMDPKDSCSWILFQHFAPARSDREPICRLRVCITEAHL